jgi:hypothetical protein
MPGTGYVVTGGGSGGVVSWGDVQNKPEEFPPEDHTHGYAEITGKPSTFPPDTHSHDYAATGHSHAAPTWDSVTGKPSTVPPDAHSHTYASITGKPSEFPPEDHSHATADVTGLDAALAEPPRVYAWNGSAYVLSTTTDIYIGPSDPGSGLWIDTDA